MRVGIADDLCRGSGHTQLHLQESDFAIKLENKAKNAVCGRMLWAKVDCQV